VTWDQLRGHSEQVEMFRRSIGRCRLSHAYLFAGPDGVGKKQFARLLAKCFMCQTIPDAELKACGQCSGCKQVIAGTHPDVFAVGCPEGKSALTIEVFVGSRERRGREGLCYELSLRPMAGRRKIAIIDDADLMNKESSNALLKNLEEPPKLSLLILITANPDGILSTIRSRCQLVRFAPLSQDDIAELLIELELAQGTAEAQSVAAISEGSLTTAGQILSPGLRELRELLYDHLASEQFNSRALTEIMAAGLEELGGTTIEQRRNAAWLVQFVIEFYRSVMLRLSGNGSGASIPQVEVVFREFHDESADDLERIMDLLNRSMLTGSQLRRNMSVPLCLEALFDDLGRLLRSAVIRQRNGRNTGTIDL